MRFRLDYNATCSGRLGSPYFQNDNVVNKPIVHQYIPRIISKLSMIGGMHFAGDVSLGLPTLLI